MRDLVRNHRGEFRRLVGQRDQAARDVEIAAGEGKGVGHGRIQDGDLVAARGVVRSGDQAVHDPRHLRLEVRVLVDAAIFGDYPRILARPDCFFRGARHPRRNNGHRIDARRRAAGCRKLTTGEKHAGRGYDDVAEHAPANAQV